MSAEARFYLNTYLLTRNLLALRKAMDYFAEHDCGCLVFEFLAMAYAYHIYGMHDKARMAVLKVLEYLNEKEGVVKNEQNTSGRVLS